MSDCDLFRADLDACRDDMLDRARRQQVKNHVQRCRFCSEEIRQLDVMEAEIRANANQWMPSAGLWGRVQNSVKFSTAQKVSLLPKYRKPTTWVAAALLLITIAAVGFNQVQWRNSPSSNSVAAVLVNEFHTFVVSQRQLDYSDSQPMAIRQWFGDKVEFRAPMPIETEGLQLAGGRLCNMLDQRVASYMYQSDGAWVSLYIMKSKSALGEDISDEVMLRGYGYIEWENNGLHYSLVGDISSERLRRVAETIFSRQISTDRIG